MPASPQDFMQQVVAWPGLNGPGYVNLHWKPTRVTSAHDFRGKPFKEVQDFMQFAQYAATKPGIYKEVYFCMASQSATGKLIHGTPIAARSKPCVMFYKSIWIDVDVKEGGYVTVEEAIEAIFKFVADASLPKPSALVLSGGGVHVYWIADRALTKAEWWPYAHGLKAEVLRLGLKCDAGLTTDEVRVLRVPGTYNNKTSTPRPVRLAYLGDNYDFGRALSRLADVGGQTPASVTAPVTAPRGPDAFPFDEALFPKGGMHKAFVGEVVVETDILGSGITLHADTPLDPTQIFKHCKHYRHAAATHGKTDNQGLWMQTVLGATWFVNGREIAHALSDEYLKYDKAKTDAMYDRKLKERADNPNLGWPGCEAFQSAGAKCKTCPFHGKLRSPLNLAERVALPKAVSAAPAEAAELDLPEGYTVNPETGWICEIGTKNLPNGMTEDVMIPLFMSKLRNFEALAGDRALKFQTSLDGGRWGDVVLSEIRDLVTEQTVVKQLRIDGVKPFPRNQGKIIQFMTSFMAKLDLARLRAETVTFGWLRRTGKEVGFAYGGRVVLEGGNTQVTGATDPEIMRKYMPVGDPTLWRSALKLVTDRHHPALHCIAAATYGAPLMFATGKYNVVVSAYSEGSGAHKSTALHLGLSVWGCPKTTKETPQSTRKGLIRHLGFIRNLPLYWDEITTPEKMDIVRSIINDTTEGANGSRMHQDRSLFTTEEWQTLMLVCANTSLVKNIITNIKDTDATLERVFEFFVEKQDDTLVEADVSRAIDDLNHSYGHAGLLYQEAIGRDPAAIKAEVIKIEADFTAAVGTASVARFRRAAATCIFAGAKLANEKIGTEFKLDEMWTFLKKAYITQTDAIVGANSIGGSKENTIAALTQFFKAHVQNALWVGSMPTRKVGKQDAITYIAGPTSTRAAPIHIRLVVGEKVIEVSKQRLTDYLANIHRTPGVVIEGLIQHFGAKQIDKINLAVGTGVLGSRETILRIPVVDGGPFVDSLYANTTMGAAATGSTGGVDTATVTGLAAGLAVAQADNAYVAANGETLPVGAAGTTIINDGRPT